MATEAEHYDASISAHSKLAAGAPTRASAPGPVISNLGMAGKDDATTSLAEARAPAALRFTTGAGEGV